MTYLNTKWIFNFNDNKGTIQFVVRKDNNIYYLDCLLTHNNSDTQNQIIAKLINLPNNVYRTGDIIIENEVCFKEYSVKSINLMLKFRNNKISPVSYVTLNSMNKNNKKRSFTFNMDSIKEYGSFSS
tara:strand:+ start:897 stop:1277 length:381 start_codon:yes stop_codon:yes gene_type:complete